MQCLNFRSHSRSSPISSPILSVPISTAVLFSFFLAFSNCASAHEAGEHAMVPPIWPYHASLVFLGFAFMTTGMFVARFMRGKKWWLKAHRAAALTGASFAVIGFTIAAYMVSTYMETYFARGTHSYLGVTALLFVISTPLIGFMQFRIKDDRIRTIHRWFGRTTLVLMLANVLVGIQMLLMALSG